MQLSEIKVKNKYTDELSIYYKKPIIYKLSFSNGKIYIGQTNNLKKRLYSYLSKDNKSNHLAKKAILKYGLSNISIDILETCFNQEDLNNKEKYYILLYESYILSKGYNLDMGGSNGIPTPQAILKKIESSKKVKVGSYDLEGNLIKIFNSVKEASRGLNISDSDIHRACKNGGIRNGYLFSKSLEQKIGILSEKSRRGKSHIKEFIVSDIEGNVLYFDGYKKVSEFLGCSKEYVANLVMRGNYYNKKYKVEPNVS